MSLKKLKYIVGRKEEGKKLLAFLREKNKSSISVKAIKRAIDDKHCLVNGKVERFSTRTLSSGDRIEIDLEKQEKKEAITVPILFENDEMIICNKPSGIVCENEVFNHYLPTYRGKLILVHRLDKETTGALILAKNAKAKERLVSLFEKNEVQKFYVALVDGEVKAEKGKIENYLGKKFSYEGQSLWGKVPKTKGRLAITLWKRLKKSKNASLILCQPVTGRTHQIRVHMSEMGHPILGDYQYGKNFKSPLKPKRHLLHAYRIKFENIEVTAPLPKDFTSCERGAFD